jgi:hypothetical protein
MTSKRRRKSLAFRRIYREGPPPSSVVIVSRGEAGPVAPEQEQAARGASGGGAPAQAEEVTGGRASLVALPSPGVEAP